MSVPWRKERKKERKNATKIQTLSICSGTEEILHSCDIVKMSWHVSCWITIHILYFDWWKIDGKRWHKINFSFIMFQYSSYIFLSFHSLHLNSIKLNKFICGEKVKYSNITHTWRVYVCVVYLFYLGFFWPKKSLGFGLSTMPFNNVSYFFWHKATMYHKKKYRKEQYFLVQMCIFFIVG